MDISNCFRNIDLTEEEMKDRTCSCPENPDVDEFGDNSWLPCMDMGFETGIALTCKACIYCTKKNK